MSVPKSLIAVVIPIAGLLGMAAWWSSSAQQPSPTAAEQPAKTKEKPIPREKYRFDGKNFAQWQEYALAELKVQCRVEAIHAMQAFGVRGYGPEAAATIFQILREHCREFPDWGNYEVYNVFKDAFRKIGQPSVAVLLPGLNEPALRELCLRTLVRSVGEPADVQVPALEPADVRVLVKITLGNSPEASSHAIQVSGRRFPGPLEC